MLERNFLLIVALACGGDSSQVDGGVDGGDSAVDSSVQVDSAVDSRSDSVAPDAADVGTDAGPGGFGTILGPCAMITGELTSASPSYFLNRLDFEADPFDDPEDLARLTPGAQEILAEGTAGGGSGLSEALAFDVLARCEGAMLLKSETEIVYTTTGALTDILIDIRGIKIGVSVTRAFIFPTTAPFTVEIATERLTDKLTGVLSSSANVAPEDAWSKQILLIMAYADMHAESIMSAWNALDPSLTADTIVYVVITDGSDEPLY